VTSERGKKRALVTAGRHVVWNWVPNDTTECYDRVNDPTEEHDLWLRDLTHLCQPLKSELQRVVAALALPAGAAEKLARGVVPAGAPPPRPAHPVDAMLGDEIQVRGFDVSPEPLPPGGGEVAVTIHFTSRKRLEGDWKLFFHLEGPGGFRNLDHVPVEGFMPPARWRPGQSIRDTMRIPFPPGGPRGTYTVYLGAYRGAAHLAVTPKALVDPAGRLKLGSFEVK
jgi:hypothetical protein